MRIISAHENHYVLSAARGEELFHSLLDWCAQNKIAGATFTGLGAADRLEIAYYHLPTKTYERQIIDEEVEIVSLIGNLGSLRGKKMLHMHGMFGRRNLSAFGGHLFSIKISGACEIHLTALPTILNRSYDEKTGLNLLCPLSKLPV